MRTIHSTILWLAAVACLLSLASCDPMSSVDYRIYNMMDDTVTVDMHKEIMTSAYEGYSIEDDSVTTRYTSDDSVYIAILAPKQSLVVHDDWSGLYHEEQVVPFWKYIKSIKVADTELAASKWNNEQAWIMKKTGGGNFEGESRRYDLFLRNK
ncbi:MAG: hypothetical protein IKW85_06360 [Muribaculaceae bacterium]|nr:hypothetical protein [Muribaculaceae bacterium]